MTKTALLNNIDHKDLRVVTRHAAAFGDAVNRTLVFPTEFAEAQREYPILFGRDEQGAYQAVALLGLDKGENLFLDEAGWNARYVPAMHQRGPFLIGLQEGLVDGETRREPMIYVDLEHPRVSQTEGQPVFLPHGGNSPYLERTCEALRAIFQGGEIAKLMFAALEEAQLIEPVTLDVKLSETEFYTIPNYHTISTARLAALDGATLERLNRAGFLRCAFDVASSLGNVTRLIALKNAKRGQGAAAKLD